MRPHVTGEFALSWPKLATLHKIAQNIKELHKVDIHFCAKMCNVSPTLSKLLPLCATLRTFWEKLRKFE